MNYTRKENQFQNNRKIEKNVLKTMEETRREKEKKIKNEDLFKERKKETGTKARVDRKGTIDERQRNNVCERKKKER